MMNNTETFRKPVGFISMFAHTSEAEFKPVGDGSNPKQGYFIIPRDTVVRELHVKNLIVNKASNFMAKRMIPGASWGAGISYLELGTGVGTGTTQAPQAESVAQVALRSPLVRKDITSWTYLDANGNPTPSETGTLRLTTIFDNPEAIGAIVEMGLFGGDASASVGTGYMFNYKTLPVWNKDGTMKLTIVWTLSF